MNCFQVLYPTPYATTGYFPYHGRIHHQPTNYDEEPPVKKRLQEKSTEGSLSNSGNLYRSASSPYLPSVLKQEFTPSHPSLHSASAASKSSLFPFSAVAAVASGSADPGQQSPTTTEYLTNNCVLLTYFSGDVDKQIDEHFTKSLSQPSNFNRNHPGTNPVTWKNKEELSKPVDRQLIPSSLWKPSPSSALLPPSPSTALLPPAPRASMQELSAAAYGSVSIAPVSYDNFDPFYQDSVWRYSFGSPCNAQSTGTSVYDHRHHGRSNHYDAYHHHRRHHHPGLHNLTLASLPSPSSVEGGRLAAAAAVHYNTLLQQITGSCRSDSSSKLLPVSISSSGGDCSGLWKQINRPTSESRSSSSSLGHRHQIDCAFDSAQMLISSNDHPTTNELCSYSFNGF